MKFRPKMQRIVIWEAHEGETIASIDTTGNVYEAVFNWLIQEIEDNARHYVVVSSNLFAGAPIPPGCVDVVTVQEVDVGLSD